MPHLKSLLPPFIWAFICPAAQAQVAADETLRLSATIPSPWGAPLGVPMAKGTAMRLAPSVMDGPDPLKCPGAKHTFMSTAAPGLFEGNLPAPAEQSAKALGLPGRIVTQRVACANGGFDLHRADDGRVWVGLDNAVLRWERARVVASPEAVVQDLLVRHFARDLDFSEATVEGQSRWLSKTLLERFDRWFSRRPSTDEAPALNGDPYTDSQEPPQTFELARAVVEGNRAELVVTFDGGAIAPNSVRYQLLRVNGAWRIDDLIYRGDVRLSSLLKADADQ